MKFFFRIVEVKGGEAGESYRVIELSESPLVAFFRANVVAGGEGMLGVKTNTNAVAFFRGIDHSADLLEAIAKIGALPGGDLQSDFDFVSGATLVDVVERFRDQFDSSGFPRAHMRAGMSHEIRDAKNLAALQLIDESRHGALAQTRVRRTEI